MQTRGRNPQKCVRTCTYYSSYYGKRLMEWTWESLQETHQASALEEVLIGQVGGFLLTGYVRVHASKEREV